MSVTYGDIKDQFDSIFRDSGRYHLTDAQVDRFANRALREICERARYDDVAEEINSVSGTGEYSVTGDGYDVFRVEYDDEVLWPVTTTELKSSNRTWESRVGRPRFYYLDAITGDQDALTVGLYEKPNANLTNGVRVWYHAYPSEAITGAFGDLSQIDIPEWASGAVVFYMLHLAYITETPMQNLGAAAVYKLMYEDILDRLVKRSRDRHPKNWVSGAPAGPSIFAINRLPQRITP